MKMKRLILMLFSVVFLTACAPNTQKILDLTLPEQTRFLFLGSDPVDPGGKLMAYDLEGNTLLEEDVDIQDVTKGDDFEDRLYVAGARHNSNLLIQNGTITSFNLLDEPKYTGSTAVTLDAECVYASMNGAISEEHGYVSVLVARDIATGKTKYRVDVPLYTSKILKDANKLYLVGTNLGGDHDDAVLVILDKATGEMLQKKIFSDYREIFDIFKIGQQLYVNATRKSDFKQEIYQFKDGGFEPLRHPFVHEFGLVASDEKFMYIYAAGKLSKLAPNGEILAENQNLGKDTEYLRSLQIEDGMISLNFVSTTFDDALLFRIELYQTSNLEPVDKIQLTTPRYTNMYVYRLPKKYLYSQHP